jgi:hypothetical protein
MLEADWSGWDGVAGRGGEQLGVAGEDDLGLGRRGVRPAAGAGRRSAEEAAQSERCRIDEAELDGRKQAAGYGDEDDENDEQAAQQRRPPRPAAPAAGGRVAARD